MLDTVNKSYRELFDPELEEILRETEGYELDPPEPEEDTDTAEEDGYEEPDEESSAQRIIRDNAEKRDCKKKTKLVLIGFGIVAVLAVILVIMLSLRSGDTDKSYEAAFKAAQEYYDAGDYDNALAKLREALEIKRRTSASCS